MKSLIIKGAIGTVGVSGLAVGGYYGVQAINSKSTSKNNSQKVDTPWEAFEKTHEIFGAGEWQTKYDEFRKNNYDAFSSALKKGRGNNIVVKVHGQEDQAGVANFKGWCEALFKLRQKVENAKAYCAKPKTSQEALNRPA